MAGAGEWSVLQHKQRGKQQLVITFMWRNDQFEFSRREKLSIGSFTSSDYILRLTIPPLDQHLNSLSILPLGRTSFREASRDPLFLRDFPSSDQRQGHLESTTTPGFGVRSFFWV